MKFTLALLLAISFTGCNRMEITKLDLKKHFEEEISRHEEVVFRDSSNLGAKMDGSILTLHFAPASKVRLYTWGDGFSNYSGKYTLPEKNVIELDLEGQSWPELSLSREGGLFILNRRNGIRSLTKSHILTDRNGVRTSVDDADIYAEARSLIFPLTQIIKAKEEGEAE